jgi:hypothetical protein
VRRVGDVLSSIAGNALSVNLVCGNLDHIKQSFSINNNI